MYGAGKCKQVFSLVRHRGLGGKYLRIYLEEEGRGFESRRGLIQDFVIFCRDIEKRLLRDRKPGLLMSYVTVTGTAGNDID